MTTTMATPWKTLNRAVKAKGELNHPVVSHPTYLRTATTLGTSVEILEMTTLIPRMMETTRIIPRVPLPFLVPQTHLLNFLPCLLDPPQPSPRLGYASPKFMTAWIKQSCAHFSCNAILTSVTAPALSALVLQRSSMPYPTYLAPRFSILSLPSSARSRPSLSGFRIGMPSRASFR